MVDHGLTLEFFRVHAKGVAGSDHRMISMRMTIQPLGWTYFENADWQALIAEISPAWLAWLKNFRAVVEDALLRGAGEKKGVKS